MRVRYIYYVLFRYYYAELSFRHKKTPTNLSGLKQRFENSFLTSVPYAHNITT